MLQSVTTKIENDGSKVMEIVHRLLPGRELCFDCSHSHNICLGIQDDVSQKTHPKKGWKETPWGIRPYWWNARWETERTAKEV